MKHNNTSPLLRAAMGAFFGAMLTGVCLFVFMFLAFAVSAGAFTLIIEEMFTHFFGEHWFVTLLTSGAVVRAAVAAYRSLRRV